jgi:hypothetical protein
MGLRKGVEKVSGEAGDYESGKGGKVVCAIGKKHNYKVCPLKECFLLVLTESSGLMFKLPTTQTTLLRQVPDLHHSCIFTQ